MSQIGMNLRVTECCDQGGRKYMEDRYAVHFERNEKGVVEFGYFGVFDGHGGAEAAKFARDRLLEEITKYDEFWTDHDENVCQAIKAGFLDTHKAMWKERDKWSRTSSGFASTAGTTASIAIIKNCKLYIGHVGDSGIVLGQQDSPTQTFEAVRLTEDHKPESPEERQRIEKSGGCVMRKAGVNRVVWNRPRNSHKGPVRRSTQIDQIPFLAVARSLGDLWSYDYKTEEFVVSPEPDVSVRHLFPRKDRCLILGSDGLWNMLSAEESCRTVQYVEKEVEKLIISDPNVQLNHWVNVSEKLVKLALHKWRSKMMRADNTSAMVVMIDPLGPSRWLQLQKKREDHLNKLNLKNNNCLENSSVSPESDRSDTPDFITETDRNAPTPIINGDFILPLTPKSATPRVENSPYFVMPMDEDYDEVDGDLSIVSNSRLPSIGSEIVIDSSTPSSSGKLITDDIQCSNGELDNLEAEVMKENLLKNFKSPMNKNPTVPLLKTESSFMTFSGAPPASLRLESVKGNSPVSAFSGKGNGGKLQKLHTKKIGGSPQESPSLSSAENYSPTDDIFPSSDSPCKMDPFLEEPDSPVRINPFTGRPGVKIIREYLYNSEGESHPSRPFTAKILPRKPGDTEVVREYLDKKNSDDSVVVNLMSRKEKPDKLPIFSKSKKFNVTIIREYLMKKKKKKHIKKTHSKSMPLLPAETPASRQANFRGEVSMPSCSNSAEGKCGWAKWLSGKPITHKKLKSLKGRPTTKPSVTIVSNNPSVASNGQLSSTSDSRQRSASFTNLTSGQPVVEAKKSVSLADVTKTDVDRRRSNSLGNLSIGHVLKIKNGDENSFSSVKTRNSPRGFGASCSVPSVHPKRLHSEHAMTGKEQIDSSSPALVRRVLIRKTPARSDNKNTHQRSKSAPSLSIKRKAVNSLRSAFQKKPSAANITPVRVLRSVMGLKRKSAIISSPDVLATKRMRHSSKGRHS